MLRVPVWVRLGLLVFNQQGIYFLYSLCLNLAMFRFASIDYLAFVSVAVSHCTIQLTKPHALRAVSS
jgi:hypothetical protein